MSTPEFLSLDVIWFDNVSIVQLQGSISFITASLSADKCWLHSASIYCCSILLVCQKTQGFLLKHLWTCTCINCLLICLSGVSLITVTKLLLFHFLQLKIDKIKLIELCGTSESEFSSVRELLCIVLLHPTIGRHCPFKCFY